MASVKYMIDEVNGNIIIIVIQKYLESKKVKIYNVYYPVKDIEEYIRARKYS